MASTGDDKRTTRREAVRTVGRWCGLAVLGGVAAWLLRRSVGAGAIGRPGDILCSSCPALARCTLPRADQARRQGVGLVTPVRVARPGRESAAVPLCQEGREEAAARRESDSQRTS